MTTRKKRTSGMTDLANPNKENSAIREAKAASRSELDREIASMSESDTGVAHVRNGSGGEVADEHVNAARPGLRIRRRARTKKAGTTERTEKTVGVDAGQKRIGAKDGQESSALPFPDKDDAKRNAADRKVEAAAGVGVDGASLSEADRQHGSPSESDLNAHARSETDRDEGPRQEKTSEAEEASERKTQDASSEKYFSSFRNPQTHPRLSARDAGVSLIQRRQKRTAAVEAEKDAAQEGSIGIESAADQPMETQLLKQPTSPEKDHQLAADTALPSPEPDASPSEGSAVDDLDDPEALKREFDEELAKMMLRPLPDFDAYGNPIPRFRKEIDRDYHLGTEAARVHDDSRLQEIANRYKVSWGRVVWNRARRLDESLITAAVGVEWHCMFELFSNYADSLRGYLTVEEIVQNIQAICARYYEAVHGVVPVPDAKRLALLSYEIIETALSVPAFRRKMCENAVSVEHQLVVEAVKQLMMPDSATFTLDDADTFHASAFWRKDMEPTEEDAKAVREYWNGIQGFTDSVDTALLSVEGTKSHSGGESGSTGGTAQQTESSSSGGM